VQPAHASAAIIGSPEQDNPYDEDFMSEAEDQLPAEPQPSTNPEGEIPERPAEADPHAGRNVSGREADEAADRATADEAVTRDDVIDQSAYKDNTADVGQQAASADREALDRKP
jgi:hypothetical protein